MAPSPNPAPDRIGQPWTQLLKRKDRSDRLRKYTRYFKLAKGMSFRSLAEDLSISRAKISHLIRNPSVEFAIGMDYLYGVDCLEIYPELHFLRDRWMEEFADHLNLLTEAAKRGEHEAVIELAEACKLGISLYSSPDLVLDIKRIKGEAVVAHEEAEIQSKRQNKTYDYKMRRALKYGQEFNT